VLGHFGRYTAGQVITIGTTHNGRGRAGRRPSCTEPDNREELIPLRPTLRMSNWTILTAMEDIGREEASHTSPQSRTGASGQVAWAFAFFSSPKMTMVMNAVREKSGIST